MENKMKGKIFKANEITSILSKEKTMFREVIKHRHLFKIHNVGGSSSEEISEIRNAPLKMDDNFDEKNDVIEYLLKNSPYQVGQKIFCKESWSLFEKYGLPDSVPQADFIDNKNLVVAYKQTFAGSENLEKYKWKPAQHMKQEYSRLTPLIKEIRVERLGEISEENAIAEGVMNHLRIVHYNPVEYFRQLWNATHKKPEEKFEANPWVWIVEFKKMD